MPNKKRGNHRCGTCFGRFNDRCAAAHHMIPCPAHPDTYHVPSHKCVSCKEVEDAAARARQSERAAIRQAEIEQQAAMEKREWGGSDERKEAKKAKKAAEKQKEREKREERERGLGLSGSTEKKVRRYGKMN